MISLNKCLISEDDADGFELLGLFQVGFKTRLDAAEPDLVLTQTQEDLEAVVAYVGQIHDLPDPEYGFSCEVCEGEGECQTDDGDPYQCPQCQGTGQKGLAPEPLHDPDRDIRLSYELEDDRWQLYALLGGHRTYFLTHSTSDAIDLHGWLVECLALGKKGGRP